MNSDRPTVSVLIPVYNAGPYFIHAVQSVLDQTYSALQQVVIIDDGSTDNTALDADTAKARDPRVTVIHTSNCGIAAARNRALDVAIGQFVFWVDGDDILHPDAIAVAIDCQSKTDTDIVVLGVTKKLGTLGKGNGCNEIMHPSKMLENLLRQHHFVYNTSLWAKLWRRTLFDELRFRPGTIFEDLDVVPRAIARANAIAVCHRHLYYYRCHETSYMHTLSPRLFDALDVTRRLEQWLTDNPTVGPSDSKLAIVPSARLAAAARDRRFSAVFNAFNLIVGMDDNTRRNFMRDSCLPTADALMEIIRQYRVEVLSSRHARLKNRTGALLSYGGKGFLTTLACVHKYFFNS